jgi:MFS family permease
VAVADPLPPVLARARWAVLGAFLATGSVVGSWGARIPAVRNDLGLSEGALGTALLGASIGAVAGAWLGGVAERRVGARALIAWSWPLLGATLALPALVPSWAMLAAALLLLGVAMGVLDVSMNAAGVRVEDAAARPLLSGLHAGWSGGVLLGAATGSIAVAAGLEPDVHLASAAAVLVAAGVPARPWLPADGVGGRRPDPDDHDLPLADDAPAPGSGRRMAALAAICGCVFLVEGAAIDWSGVLVDDAFGGTPLQASLAVFGVSAGGLVGRLLGNRAVAALGARPVVRLGAVVAVVGLAGALAVAEPVPAPLLLFLLGFGLAPAVPLAFGAAGRLRGSHGIAIVTTAGYGSYLTGPLIIGSLAEVIGLRGALLVPAALAGTVAVLALALDDRTEPQPGLAPPLGAAD